MNTTDLTENCSDCISIGRLPYSLSFMFFLFCFLIFCFLNTASLKNNKKTGAYELNFLLGTLQILTYPWVLLKFIMSWDHCFSLMCRLFLSFSLLFCICCSGWFRISYRHLYFVLQLWLDCKQRVRTQLAFLEIRILYAFF